VSTDRAGRGLWALTVVLLLLLMLGLGLVARADVPPPSDKRAVLEDASRAALSGPVDVRLAGQATLQLPAGMRYVPQPQAGRMLRAMGNPGHDGDLQGLIVSQKDGRWFAIVRFVAAGYVKDDDARDWKADDLLARYREGTEAGNAERRQMGVSQLEVQGWAEAPAYDAVSHRLVWAMTSRIKGSGQPGSDPADASPGVNYNTSMLGREGYLMLNLVTSLDQLPAVKTQALVLLASLNFDEGKRYADFQADTDPVAEYGLAALVVGVAAKKLGLLALAGVFFLKFAKLILVGLALLGAVAMTLFRRRQKASRAP
jgi:uncharacterized membrane-anchored protein